jgi:predicted secreted acid phosphatase
MVCAGCATRSLEPANLEAHKREIRSYVKTGAYEEDLERVAEDAKKWIRQRVERRTPDERLAVVFDLDETLFLNWSRIDASDFTYVRDDWNRWVEQASAPAIKPIYEVYQLARAEDVEVIFITGRPERHRSFTEANLQHIGCDDYADLICAPDGHEGSAASFKAAARERIQDEGQFIIANLGDQRSDLAGGHAEKVFKLPNPFYLTD